MTNELTIFMLLAFWANILRLAFLTFDFENVKKNICKKYK
jgi:hypothetical protein